MTRGGGCLSHRPQARARAEEQPGVSDQRGVVRGLRLVRWAHGDDTVFDEGLNPEDFS